MNALARFDRDVLTIPGATDVIVMEGIDDIGNAGNDPTPTAADLIAGHQQLIERAHTHFRGCLLLHARRGNETSGAQSVDPNQRRV
jgi:hypothetical protein